MLRNHSHAIAQIQPGIKAKPRPKFPSNSQSGLVIALLTLLIATLWLAAPLSAAPNPVSPALPVRLLVKVKTNANPASMARLHANAHARVLHSEAAIGFQLVEIPAAQVETARETYLRDQNVTNVSNDTPVRPTMGVNDPLFQDGSQYNLQQIQAPAAWEISTGANVVIAVVDSGVDPNHPDLRDRLVPGRNIYDGNDNTADGCGHGTMVAGIAAATANNSAGIAGVAYSAKIMPVKVMNDSCGSSYSRIINGIVYAADHGARIIVVATGASIDSVSLHDAVIYARNKGAIVIASAGNDGTDTPFYPGSYAEAFTVSGTDQNDSVYAQSNFGSQIDVAAPAVSIMTTALSSNGGPSYATFGGTSAAAPHVAGVAALLLAQSGSYSVGELETMIANSADDIGAPGIDPMFGYGRVNALAAVTASSRLLAAHLHVADLDGSSQTAAKGRWSAAVVVTVHDGNHQPVVNVAVSGLWNTGAAVRCITNSSGQCAVTSATLRKNVTSTIFSVSNLAMAERTYLAADNHDPESDSNGSMIAVSRPFETTPGSSGTIHLGDLTLTISTHHRSWTAKVTALVHDANHAPVANATVAGNWSGAYTNVAACVTNSAGQCTMQTPKGSSANSAVQFTLSAVSHPSFAYDPTANHAASTLTPIGAANLQQRFNAFDQAGTALVELITATPIDASGFTLYRSGDGGRDNAAVVDRTAIPEVDLTDSYYSWVDDTVIPGATYTYWLVKMENGVETAVFGPSVVTIDAATTQRLYLPVLTR